MQNYKDLNNKVHVLDSIEFEHLLPSGCVQITVQEAEMLNTPSSPPVPQVVSKYQGCEALDDAGLLTPVEGYFASEAATAKEKLAWRTITEMRRTSPMTLKLAGMLGLTSAQVDDLFILAATKEA